MVDFLKIFNELSNLNVNDKIEKKPTAGGKELSYLSWAYAVGEFTKKYPNYTYEIKMFEGKPYIYDDNLGYMVFTSITIGDMTKDMWLPVMDSNNKAMKKESYSYKTKYGEKFVESATMFDVNKTIMRCLVKNMAMFGLGLYIYAGDDLPECEQDNKEQNKVLDNIKDVFHNATEIKTPTLDDIKNIMMDNHYESFGANEFYDYYSKNSWKSKTGQIITTENVGEALKRWELSRKNEFNKLAEKGARNV